MNLFLARSLFVSTRADQPACLCRPHHFLSLEPGGCPFCDAELLSVESVVDELIELARFHGVELMVFEEKPELLDRFDGLAAPAYVPPDLWARSWP